MKLLEKANRLYGKHLYLIVPSISILIAFMEIILGKNDFLHIIAYIMMGFVSLSFLGFYAMSGKRNIVFFLIELYMFFYISFLSLSRKLAFNDLIWQIFICTAVFVFVFILALNKKYKE